MFSWVSWYSRRMPKTLVHAAPIANLDAILTTMDAAVASSTQRAYATAQASYTDYCERHGWDLYAEDSNGAGEYIGRVLSFLQSMADEGRSTSTINKTLAGIKHHASRLSPLGFMILNSSREVKAFMAGVTRHQKTATKRQAEAFTLEDLRAIYKSLRPRSVRNLRNRALIALGIATALRSQSLADLDLGDVTKALSVDGLNVRVRWSKTDQEGNGETITVRRSKSKALDPVAAVQAWIDYLSAMGITDERAPLFPHVRGTGVQLDRMSNPSATVTDVVRQAVLRAGIVPNLPGTADAYSSHSLRSTHITLSYAAGVPESQIAAVTKHKNMNTLRGYDRTASEQAAQVDYLGG